MFDSSFPSAGKRHYVDDTTYLPTAEKSRYQHDTQEFIERTPEKIPVTFSAKKSSRLSEARRSVNDCIQMVSEKKKLNEEAIEEVRLVNHEILGSLTNYNPIKHGQYQHRNKTTEQFRRDDSRDIAAVSQFEWRPTTSPRPLFQEEPKHSYKQVNLSQENVDLRAKLNEELKRNNELLKYITGLESEVSALRASKSQSGTNAGINQVLQQNRFLRSQLAGSQGNAPYNLIEELQRLKAQNNELRKDTVTLLRAKQY